MKINLIYYKNILDIIISRFIHDYNDSFTKINNYYVLSESIDRNKFKKYIITAFKKFISELHTVLNNNKHDKTIIIGACYPKNNILLSFNTAKFPNNLQYYLVNKPEIKYILKESDILIDIDAFNSIALEIFNDLFKSKKLVEKIFSSNAKQLIFLSHNNLDCYMVFKAIKWLYGKSNCVNIWKNKLNTPCNHIIAINDVVSKYANNKKMLNSNKKFKEYVTEIKEYLSNELGFN